MSSVYYFICGSRPPTRSRMGGRIGDLLEKNLVCYSATFDPILKSSFSARGSLSLSQTELNRLTEKVSQSSRPFRARFNPLAAQAHTVVAAATFAIFS
jgi:hypothetical protein